MIKNDFFKVIENIDLANPYGFSSLYLSNLAKVDYSSNMILNAGEYTWDIDEKAYWIKPNFIDNATPVVGYIRYIDENMIISINDIIEVTFEIKTFSDSISEQNIGIRLDFLNYDNTIIASKDFFFTKNTNGDYDFVKIKQKVPPYLGNAVKCAVVLGTPTSVPTSSAYEYKIRNAFINITRNNSTLKTPFDLGLGVTNFSRFVLRDNGTTMPLSGARDITLKSGIYGFTGSDRANNSLTGNGMLIVLPYRSDNVGGSNYIEQIAIICSDDNDGGIWKRSYNGITGNWSSWIRIGESLSGATELRPTGVKTGFCYYDTTLSRPIWWTGSAWKDATGTTR